MMAAQWQRVLVRSQLEQAVPRAAGSLHKEAADTNSFAAGG
jgi:hypothetical protein